MKRSRSHIVLVYCLVGISMLPAWARLLHDCMAHQEEQQTLATSSEEDDTNCFYCDFLFISKGSCFNFLIFSELYFCSDILAYCPNQNIALNPRIIVALRAPPLASIA
ncbi:MAG: hypothetical protein HC892_19250 [Saprospiraceae bacterium]|nr:hypothetical protein [Saprospiraceae bacterium]